ncbi:MAG: helix-turn-helix transcriptional regulator [Candidatus Margulisbacteria bacterium]|nr:helix-turn-helix transcriptional regulator [Candidatus Margulisiibacteriota bacterium]
MRIKREVDLSISLKIKKIGENITFLRKSKNMSCEKLAYSIGISKSFLGYVEKGLTNPTVETLYLIADGLDCEIVELFK